jgi:adenylyltransferase/sulfurtransferase
VTTLRIPTPLRPYAGGQQQIEVKSKNVAGALDELIDAHPELKRHLFTEAGELRAFVNLFVNDENVRDLQGTQTPLKPTDTLMILPSIAGGAL